MKNGKGTRYGEVFKRHVVEEIEAGRITMAETRRRYGILGHSTVLKWCRRYGKKRSRYDKVEGMDKEIELMHLRNENKALKQELDDTRLKNVVLETMVDVAEREFNIPIRKKYGTKRSGR